MNKARGPPSEESPVARKTVNKPKSDFGTRLGDSGYEVEWCSHIPELYPGEADHDNAVCHFEDFRTLEEAKAFAKKVYPQDQYGSVRITPFEIVRLSDEYPFGKTREHTADPEYYEGEDQ